MPIHNALEASPHARQELMLAPEKVGGRDELADLLYVMHDLIVESELETRELSALEKLREGLEQAAMRYLEAVIEHFVACEPGRPTDVRVEKDAARRSAHNAFVDSVRIYVRNAEEFGVEGAERFQSFKVAPDDDTRRRWLGRLALVYGFNTLGQLMT